MRLFLQSTPFYRFLTLQFSGLRLVTLFATSLMSWEVRKAAGSPMVPANAITSENWGDGGFVWGFLFYKRFCFCRYVGVRIEEETVVNTIHATGR